MPARMDVTLQRLFVDAPMMTSAALVLDKAQSNYLVSVLRMRVGDSVLVFNGRDGEWRAVLTQAERKGALLTLAAQTRLQPLAGQITLAFAPLKQARLDYVVQKAVEMGAAHLAPVITHRTQVSRLNSARFAANIIEAAEQCGVLVVPSFAAETKLAVFVTALPAQTTLVFCDEFADAANPLNALKALPRGGAIVVLIGPEGGFDDSERQMLLGREKVIRLSLGPRILRGDTAAVAALAAVQMAAGDWC
jgi:16S rRNA (uracil1498-N3)-methyltransferase